MSYLNNLNKLQLGSVPKLPGINYKVSSTIYNKIYNWHHKRTGDSVIGIIKLKRHVDKDDKLVYEYLVCASNLMGNYGMRVDAFTSNNGFVYARYFARSWSQWCQI